MGVAKQGGDVVVEEKLVANEREISRWTEGKKRERFQNY